jgi:ABC-2 type transport system permease protein
MSKYWKPWKIAQKEFKVTRRKKSVISYVVALPLLLAFFFTLVVKNDFASGISSDYQLGFESLTYFYVVFAAIVPSSLAAYSIVGEKVEKSLEPLLATPVTDGEILLGKSIAAFLPSILSIWAGASIFMATTDLLTHGSLSFYYFPNWNAVIMLFLLAPLAAITSIELAVIVSSRVTDVRGANQLASLMFVPFMVVFVAALEGTFSFSISNLLIFSVFLTIAVVALFRLSRSIFQREEILTKWK